MGRGRDALLRFYGLTGPLSPRVRHPASVPRTPALRVLGTFDSLRRDAAGKCCPIPLLDGKDRGGMIGQQRLNFLSLHLLLDGP